VIFEEDNLLRNKNISEQILNFYNNSEYREICQTFLASKGIYSLCNYYYSVYNVTLRVNQGYVFHCIVSDPDSITTPYIQGTEYMIKITKDFVIIDWYKSKLTSGIEDKYWLSLDLNTHEEIEYYILEFVKDDLGELKGAIATKYDTKTKVKLATTYFVHYDNLSEEKQKQLDSIPYGKTMVGYRERNGQFIIEYLPSHFQHMFDEHNIQSFDPALLVN